MRRIIAVCAVVPVVAAAAVWSQESKFTVETVGIQPAGQPAGQPGGQCEAPDGKMMPCLARNEYSLIVEDLKMGEGAECERRSDVTVHYHGTLADGTVFDSTRGKEPASFALNRLIPGWQAGVPGMKVGGIRRLTIPPVMAYGSKDRIDQATGKVTIPANSTLTFAIELVAVKGASLPAAVTPPAAGGELKIEDLAVGTGKECPPGATVKIHYRGTLLDGSEFDSSYKRGEPSEFPLANLIQGWQEGIPGMKVGGKRKLVIPPEKAYGQQGRPGIPPNSTLVFEIELLDVK